jgi:FAD/FMN-containing dehydrogenase
MGTAVTGEALAELSRRVLGNDPRARRCRLRRGTHAALGEHLSERRWLNYLGDDQGDDAIRGAYGPNYDRLVELKRRYDPDNVFHHNHNIKP